MKRLSSWPISAAAALALAGVLGSGACTTHGEGGRCDPGNVPPNTTQNADCDNGLVCIPGTELALPDGGHPASGTYFCCPQDRTTLLPGDICALNPTSPGSDASIPDGATESSTSDATTDQSTSDVVTDSPSDATSTDAAGDVVTDAPGD